MSSAADADGDTSLPRAPPPTTLEAMAEPAQLTRKGQVDGFDYGSLKDGQSRLLRGLGVPSPGDQTKAMDKLTRLVKQLHPYYDQDTKEFSKNRLQGSERNKLCEELYNAMPMFCKVPLNFQSFAMSKLLTYAISYRIRRKQNQSDTVPNSRRRAEKRYRRDADVDESASDSESESESTNARKQKRRRQGAAQPRAEHVLDSVEGRDSRSYGRLTPIMTYSPMEQHLLAPSRGPDYSKSTVLFYSVKDGKTNKKLAKIKPDQLRGISHAIEWNKLVAEATAAEDDGFQYNKRLYLSPRLDQELPIRTQATLSSALEDMNTGDLLFTTMPVDPDLDMKDPPLSDSPRNKQLSPKVELEQHQQQGQQIVDDAKQNTSGMKSPPPPPPTPPPPPPLPPPPATPPPPPPPHSKRETRQQRATTPDLPARTPDGNVKVDIEKLMKQLKEYPSMDGLLRRTSGDGQPTRKTEARGSDGELRNRPRRTRAEKPTYNFSGDEVGEDDDDDDDFNASPLSRKGPSRRESSPTDDNRKPKDDDSDSDLEKDSDNDSENDTASNVDNNHDDNDLLRAEGDEEDRNEQAAMEATQYALTQPTTKTSYAKALKEDLAVWDRAGKTFLVGMSDLQHPEAYPNNRIPLKPGLGFDTKYSLYAHQIVGSVEVHCNSFGPKRSMIQGDEMGYGKTNMVLVAWDMNFRSVAQTYGAQIKPGTPSERSPLQWPVLEDGKLNGCAPRVGALFVSASPNGIDVWVRAFVQMFSGDASHGYLEDAWKPKLVILHSDGPKLAKQYGGSENGIYTSMATDEWAEILPQPNWSNARIAYDEKVWPADWRAGWAEESNWVPHPAATATEPSPTSTRYIIVSTNLSWKTNVGCVVIDEELGREYKEQMTAMRNLPSGSVQQRLKALTVINQLRDKKASKSGGKWQGDGTQPMQAQRKRYYHTTSKPASKMVKVREVVDLRYAAWIVIDELHSAAGADTITYRQIIDPIIAGCGPASPPGVVGITGTALYNGAGLVMTFAQKVCLEVADSKSDDPGVRALLSVKGVDFNATWKAVHDLYLKASLNPEERAEKLKHILNVDSFHKVFATMLEFYLIARDSNSKNPWGELLTILKVKLDVHHVKVVHDPEMWGKIDAAEKNVQALQKRMHDEQLEEWKERGAVPDQRPTMPTLARSNPNAYLVARIISCFPNVVSAIEGWQQANPLRRRVIDDVQEICLGGGNDVVTEALRSDESIKNSFIWDIADEACRGAKKVQLVVNEIEKLQRQKTERVVTRKEGSEVVRYRSKFVVAVGVRFARALLWAYLCQRFGSERVVGVANKKSRVNELPKWQRYFDTDKWELADGVDILVAGLKVISQSVTLTEGHVLFGFDPPTNNNDQWQYPKRQHRIGQEDDCKVRWLVTVNPATTRKNGIKPSRDIRKKNKTIESSIVLRNKGKTDFFLDMRNIQSTDAEVTVDLTNEPDEVSDAEDESLGEANMVI